MVLRSTNQGTPFQPEQNLVYKPEIILFINEGTLRNIENRKMTVTLTKQSQAASYADVQAKNFTGVAGFPTRKDMYCMYEEACDAATAINMGYEWVGDFVLLDIVTGVNKYMPLNNKAYVDPTEPPAYSSLINQGKN